MFGLPALFSFLAGKGTLAAAMPGIASVGLGISAIGGAQGGGRSEGEFDP